MESQDYDLVKQEAKEEEDRQIYSEHLGELQQALEDCFCQANKDGIEIDDIFKVIRRSVLNSQDILINIERI